MNRVRVRMYRQGLGDCFLLTFPAARRRSRTCSSTAACSRGPRTRSSGCRRSPRTSCETTGGRLDVLVVTHEHWDHVSGFLQAEDGLRRD